MGASDFGRGGRILKQWARAISGDVGVFRNSRGDDFGRGDGVWPPIVYNYSAHVISDEEKARLDEVTNLPSMYNGPIDACPT